MQLSSGDLLQHTKNIRAFHLSIVNRQQRKLGIPSDLARCIMNNETNKSLRILGINRKVWEVSSSTRMCL